MDTVDGSEIRRARVQVGRLSHYSAEISTSQVVQVFFHKQSVLSHEGVKTRLPFLTPRFCDIHVDFQ